MAETDRSKVVVEVAVILFLNSLSVSKLQISALAKITPEIELNFD